MSFSSSSLSIFLFGNHNRNFYGLIKSLFLLPSNCITTSLYFSDGQSPLLLKFKLRKLFCFRSSSSSRCSLSFSINPTSLLLTNSAMYLFDRLHPLYPFPLPLFFTATLESCGEGQNTIVPFTFQQAGEWSCLWKAVCRRCIYIFSTETTRSGFHFFNLHLITNCNILTCPFGGGHGYTIKKNADITRRCLCQ